MAKPITGKTHVGERREKRPNGDIYVYERITAYDEKTRKTYTVSQKLKGKIKSGAQEIVPTRPKKYQGERGIVDATRQHTGLTNILEWVGKVSGIDDDVHASFSEGDAAKILSIARYWIGSGGNTLPRLESWQVMHPLPYREGITEDVYGNCLRMLVAMKKAFSAIFQLGRQVWESLLCRRLTQPLSLPTLKINRRHGRGSTRMATDSIRSSF